MKHIQQCTGTITGVRDLSPTARELTITPDVPLPFVAGAFVNVFVAHEGRRLRRAFSISSSDKYSERFTLSIRHTPGGDFTPLLWERDFVGETVELMGPLGMNTADRMHAANVFLFGFGVGAGVVKALADHLLSRSTLTSLTILTGNRSIDEILHKDYFDTITDDPRVVVTYVVADAVQDQYPSGYIQDHIKAFDFTDADVYMCGQGVACTALEKAIQATQPENCTYFIEDFH